MPGVVVDGQDVFAVYEAAGEAIARARRGEGPTLIEAKTYRYYGHFQGDMVTLPHRRGARTAVKQRDAIQRVRDYAVDHGTGAAERARRDRRAQHGGTSTSLGEPPRPRRGRKRSELLTDVYVSY